MARALLNALLSTILFGVALLAPSGAWSWSRAWILIGVYLLVHAVGTVRIVRANPGLLPERAKLPVQRDQPLADKVLLLSFMTTYAGELVLTGLDQRRWHWGVGFPSGLAWLGVALFTAGWLLVMRALETNEFATMVVRHQSERGHLLVNRGVYGVVRHPMYAGLLGVLLGVPLWLRSQLGLIAALVPMGLLIGRLLVEERFLRRALPNYADYVARVRFRLVPGVW